MTAIQSAGNLLRRLRSRDRARRINNTTFDGTSDITIPAVDTTKEPTITAGTTDQYWRGDKSWQTLNKSAVGLGSVDNTADTAKEVASAGKLTTGRTLQTNLASTSTATFDGTINVTLGVTGTLPVGNGGTGATTLTGLIKGNASAAFTAATAGNDYLDTTDFDNDLASGEATLPRRNVVTTNLGLGSGTLRLTYFTARRTEAVNTVRLICNVVAAGTTLARIGLYTVASNGDLTLVASTATDTALFNSTGQVTKALSAQYTKLRGQRYAVGIIWTGTTTPQLSGHGLLFSSETAQSPRLSGAVGSQTDLASTMGTGSIGASANQYYVALVP